MQLPWRPCLPAECEHCDIRKVGYVVSGITWMSGAFLLTTACVHGTSTAVGGVVGGMWPLLISAPVTCIDCCKALRMTEANPWANVD